MSTEHPGTSPWSLEKSGRGQELGSGVPISELEARFQLHDTRNVFVGGRDGEIRADRV